MSEPNQETTRANRVTAVRRIVSVLVLTGVMGLALFGSAGRLDWPRGWWWLGAQCAVLVVNAVILSILNPGIIAERGKRHEGTKRFDKVLTLAIAPFYFGLPVVAGLDARFCACPLPDFTLWAGLALFALSDAPSVWPMTVNRHLETSVRIQHDRDHQVVSSGPYRYVRHPMYVGMCLQFLSTPLLLGTGCALVPGLIVVLLFVVRTALEDRMLQAELPGYTAYAQQTRYRLVPGVW